MYLAAYAFAVQKRGVGRVAAGKFEAVAVKAHEPPTTPTIPREPSMKVRLVQPAGAPNSCFELVEADRRKGNPVSVAFVQSDWEYSRLAGLFGWEPCRCEDRATDGTVDCARCGKTVPEMLARAYDFLREHVGEVIEYHY
jgi:hypothetical protein